MNADLGKEAPETMALACVQHYVVIWTADARRRTLHWDEAAAETMAVARVQHYVVIRTAEARRRTLDWDETAAGKTLCLQDLRIVIMSVEVSRPLLFRSSRSTPGGEQYGEQYGNSMAW